VKNAICVRLIALANILFMELVRVQVLTATRMKMTVVWEVAPCSLVEAYRRY
jgi:hypothetical protein